MAPDSSAASRTSTDWIHDHDNRNTRFYERCGITPATITCLGRIDRSQPPGSAARG
jgi:hypothetical protein